MKKWLIIYDIKNTKRLTRVMKIISEYATKVQLSVYELEDTVDIVNRIKKRVDDVIDSSQDFVAYFNICESDWEKIEKYGRIDGLKSQKEYYIV